MIAENNAIKDEALERYAAGRRVTLWGMVLNVFLSIFKITAGIIGSSQSIIADGIHSLSDLGSDLVVLVGLKVAAIPSDESHHYGHGRVESISTMIVSILLIAAALFIGYESFVGITEHHHTAPRLLPIIAAAVSILIKELLYRWTKSVGIKIESSSLEANAWHHRTDALTSIAVFIGLGVARIYPSLEILDHLIALVVAVFVVRVALVLARQVVLELMDSAPSAEIMEKVCESILEVENVQSLHKCRARHVQGKIYIDVHVQLPGTMTVLEGHRISSVVRDKVKSEIINVSEVLVHIEPVEDEPGTDKFIS